MEMVVVVMEMVVVMVRMVVVVVLMLSLLPNYFLQRMLLFPPSLLTTELHRGAKFWLVAGMLRRELNSTHVLSDIGSIAPVASSPPGLWLLHL